MKKIAENYIEHILDVVDDIDNYMEEEEKHYEETIASGDNHTDHVWRKILTLRKLSAEYRT